MGIVGKKWEWQKPNNDAGFIYIIPTFPLKIKNTIYVYDTPTLTRRGKGEGVFIYGMYSQKKWESGNETPESLGAQGIAAFPLL